MRGENYSTLDDTHSTAGLIRQTSNSSFGAVNPALDGSTTNGVGGGASPPSSPAGVAVLPPLGLAPPEKRFTRKSTNKNTRKSKTPVESRMSSGNTNDFQLSGDKKVATIIQRLAGRLRSKLSSVNFKEPQPRPRIPDADAANSSIDTDVDLSGNPDFGDRTARKRPEKPKVHIPSKLHPPPRGWAPASNFVPSTVKPTSWGRAKGVLAANKAQTLDR